MEELALRGDTLADTISELDDPAEISVRTDDELEVEVYPLREVEEYPKTSIRKALTKLMPVLDRVPGLDLR
jgi:hypothetical protein